jgi:hypothetical protein
LYIPETVNRTNSTSIYHDSVAFTVSQTKLSSSSAGNSDSPNTVALEKELGKEINEINNSKAESL